MSVGEGGLGDESGLSDSTERPEIEALDMVNV